MDRGQGGMTRADPLSLGGDPSLLDEAEDDSEDVAA